MMTFEEAKNHKKQFPELSGVEDGKKFRIMVVPSDNTGSNKSYFDFYQNDPENIIDETALHFSKDQNYRVAKIWIIGIEIEWQLLP